MLHILHGLTYNHSGDLLLQLELRGISRLNPHVPVQARPITPAILLAFHQHMHHDDSLHCSVWACSLFTFYLMARLGSILPSSRSTSTHKFLTRDRINFSVQGLLVTLLHTKTIQCGKRRLHMPLLKIESILCPVAAYTKFLSFFPDLATGPAFVFSKDGKTPSWHNSK